MTALCKKHRNDPGPCGIRKDMNCGGIAIWGAGRKSRRAPSEGFRYYIHDGARVFRFVLIGRLAGANVRELEQCYRTACSILKNRTFVVDLNGLAGWDEEGRALIEGWREGGAEVLARDEPSARVGITAVLVG
jgi:hypothetical protein